MATICLTGGTGLIGTSLTHYLISQGHQIHILTRNPVREQPKTGIKYFNWNPDKQTIDSAALAKADALIHLAGANVAEKRWTSQRKKEILDSRVNSSRLIVDALKQHPHQIKTVISASAIGWYGPDEKTIFTENMPAHDDFLGTTCRAWEESIEPVRQLGIRLVKLRTGIVLANEGGALTEFKKPLRAGIAPILGSGKQMISWIHIEDLVSMFAFALENPTLEGVYNAVAPNPVNNKTLMLTLAKTLRKFYIPIHVPAFVLKIMLGEMSIEVLKSCTVSAEKIQRTGFEFLYSKIEDGVKELINPEGVVRL